MYEYMQMMCTVHTYMLHCTLYMHMSWSWCMYVGICGSVTRPPVIVLSLVSRLSTCIPCCMGLLLHLGWDRDRSWIMANGKYPSRIDSLQCEQVSKTSRRLS